MKPEQLALAAHVDQIVRNTGTHAGGKVVGSVRVPLNSSDFSSFLLQAQSSKAKIVGLANAGQIDPSGLRA